MSTDHSTKILHSNNVYVYKAIVIRCKFLNFQHHKCCARGKMGRGEKAKRLANLPSKMAGSVIADHTGTFLNFLRPFHIAFLAGNLKN